jgi:hypothetical protein
VFRIGGNTFYDRKNKIPMKLPEFKRSRIGLISEFCGIPNGFLNQVAKAPQFKDAINNWQDLEDKDYFQWQGFLLGHGTNVKIDSDN